MDARTPRDGKTIEELGYYDPMVRETDARAVLNGERIDYWLGVGAKPTDKVAVLIKKYGTGGTHLAQQEEALQRLKLNKPTAPPPSAMPKPTPKVQEPAPAEEPVVTAEAEAAPPTDETPAPAAEETAPEASESPEQQPSSE